MSKTLTALTAATLPLAGTEEVYVVQGGNSRKATAADVVAGSQPLNSNLTSWAAITRAAGFDALVATPSSANLKALLTDETGSGAAVFATSPTLVTPALGTPSALVLTNATGLPIAGGGTGASTADSARLNLVIPTFVTSVAALQALDTSKDTVAYLTLSGRQFTFVWTAGNFSAQITAADPRYIASSANPTGSAGAWIQSGSVETGQFFQTLGASVHYLADRVMIGNAVANKGNPVASQSDWLTTFLLARGRSTGFLEFAQMGVLTNSNSNSANAVVAGAQTSSLAGAGNSIPAIFVGVNNNSSFSTNAYGWYVEAYKMSGALGGAYGFELDTMNFDAAVAINPFAQAAGQVVGAQFAGGGSLSGTQYAASAGINFWNNNSSFDKGINFGFTAINGTNGTDGNTGEAIAMATGHAITYYYGNNTKSWTLKANIGVNGNYVFSSAGTGSVVVPTLTTGTKVFFPSGGILDFNGGAYTVTHSLNLLTFSQATHSLGSISAAGSIKSQNTLAGIGYTAGAGGAVTQITSRTTGVTLNRVSGQITMFSAAGSATAATFTVTNSAVVATDTITLNQQSGTNLYNFIVTAVAAGSFNITFYTTGGTAVDAPVINFNVVKGVAA